MNLHRLEWGPRLGQDWKGATWKIAPSDCWEITLGKLEKYHQEVATHKKLRFGKIPDGQVSAHEKGLREGTEHQIFHILFKST